MKRFKAKKIKKKNRKAKAFLFIFFFFFSYIFVFNYLSKHRLKIKILKEDTNYVNVNIIDVINNEIDSKISNPINYLNKNVRINKSITVTNNNEKKKDNTVKTSSLPIIYLYNTHQTEGYINYSVYDATKLLASNLTSDGYNSLFEENSIPVFLQNNSLKYYESYKASRYYLQKAYENNNTLKYFFDIHRDSISKDKVTLFYNNKNYAKILFIIGLENNNYNENEKEAKRLNNIINNKVNGLSKGLYKKQGKKVNGVYNEDFSKYVFLIEIGSKYSTKDEVLNTLDILKESIKEFINTNYDQL